LLRLPVFDEHDKNKTSAVRFDLNTEIIIKMHEGPHFKKLQGISRLSINRLRSHLGR
jgi:hypothetical protein